MKVRPAGAALLIAVAMSVSACGSSSGGAATTPSAATLAPPSSAASVLSPARSSAGAAASPATASDNGTASGAGAFAVCTILPFAEAAALSGQPYTQGVPTVSDGMSICSYDNDDATASGINVEILDDPNGDTWSAVHAGGVTDISGLGDKALWDNDNTLYAAKGAYLVQVNGDALTQDVAQSLARPVIAALP